MKNNFKKNILYVSISIFLININKYINCAECNIINFNNIISSKQYYELPNLSKVFYIPNFNNCYYLKEFNNFPIVTEYIDAYYAKNKEQRILEKQINNADNFLFDSNSKNNNYYSYININTNIKFFNYDSEFKSVLNIQEFINLQNKNKIGNIFNNQQYGILINKYKEETFNRIQFGFEINNYDNNNNNNNNNEIMYFNSNNKFIKLFNNKTFITNMIEFKNN